VASRVEDRVGEPAGQAREVVRAVGVQGRAADDGHDGCGERAARGQLGAGQDVEAGRVPEGLAPGQVIQGPAALGGQRVVVDALGDQTAQGEMAAAVLRVGAGLCEAVGQGVQQLAAGLGRQVAEQVQHLLPTAAPGAAAGVEDAQRLVGDPAHVAVGDPVAQPAQVGPGRAEGAHQPPTRGTSLRNVTSVPSVSSISSSGSVT
jgi:hypothetical protein